MKVENWGLKPSSRAILGLVTSPTIIHPTFFCGWHNVASFIYYDRLKDLLFLGYVISTSTFLQ